ncbi:general secretion pathway protein GspB [Gallaecimonas sp. GXIMD4217]|uniref:general secretion pathway protein GspB n=1 Tax=Gallaecimonas sp. GXIMD4217 TaxID=3131927 RepID=UPI00311AEAA4
MSLLAKALRQQQALPETQPGRGGFLFDGRLWLSRALLVLLLALLGLAGHWAWPSIRAMAMAQGPDAKTLAPERATPAPAEPKVRSVSIQAEPKPAIPDPFLVPKPKPRLEVPRLPPPVTAVAPELPPIRYTGHFYASVPAERWIRLNGRQLREGDSLVPGVVVVSIAAEGAELAHGGRRQWLNALTDWPVQ